MNILQLDDLKKQYLLPRKANVHKGDFGRVLMVGGAPGMLGSVRMAAEAALRVGAGLVSVATHVTHAALISSQRPELISYGIENKEQLIALLDHADVVVAGMGLGQGAWGETLFEGVVNHFHQRLVLDADALNWLAKKTMPRHLNWVLTPHPGEAARLLKVTVKDIQSNRLAAVTQLQDQWGGICVLKGTGTLIKGESSRVVICEQGNPGMASAGMGDVLSGIIGGLLAQGILPEKAVELGVGLHAEAGDKAACIKGERGLLAMDVVDCLQSLVN